MSVFISPHNDDETLFGAFTIMRERPLVVVVFDSWLQEKRGHGVTWAQRRAETKLAVQELGGAQTSFLGFSDADPTVSAVKIRERLEEIGMLHELIFAPAFEMYGHAQHNLVAEAIDDGPKVLRYLTYTTAGKSTSKHAVPILEPHWIGAKLRALSCYRSQWAPKLGCYPHFLRDQTEYYEL